MSAVEQPKAGKSSGWTARRIVTDALLTITTILAVVAIVAIWANRQLLNPDNWAVTSTSLLQNQTIRNSTANYLVDQLYANVDVSSILSQRLPPALQPLAGPAAGALRNAAVQGTELALSRPLIQNAWSVANRAAAQALVTIIDGGNAHVSINNGAVTLNLDTIVDDVASRLGFSADLGSKLPPSVARLTIMRANQLQAIQDGGKALKGLATILYILVPVLYIAAMIIAQGRRRKTLMWVGVSGAVAGLAVVLARHIAIPAIANSLAKDASVKPTVSAVASIATQMLVEVAGAVILIGVVIIVCAWFAGPSRFATPARRWIAPFLDENPVGTYAAVVAILLLVFIWQPIPATGKPIGMIVFTVLALLGTEVLRRQTKLEFGTPALAGGGGGAFGGPPTSADRQPTPAEEPRSGAESPPAEAGERPPPGVHGADPEPAPREPSAS